MRTTTRAAARSALLLIALAAAACGGSKDSGWKPGDPVTLDVSAVFPAGTAVRDAYTGATATVSGSGSLTVTPGAEGVVLLERDGATPTAFRWDAATVYFVLTDRFFNGNPANDGSYGREPDGAQEVGTWHGGDLAGLTQKLDYLDDLGVDAVWISPPVEQVHGWVGGGNLGDFKHYAYAGYWALDFTRLDANFGTEQELQTFVDEAHTRGIRVVLDVVMNHPGYATGADLLAYLPEVFSDGTGAAFQAFQPTPPRNYFGWNDLVDYQYTGGRLNAGHWVDWWGTDWIRAGLAEHILPGSDDLTKGVAYLPDFMTERSNIVSRPPLYDRKTDTGVVAIPDSTVRDYLVKWHTDWVRTYGIDGFRCDTAKHVEYASWSSLKAAGETALAEWKAAHPSKKLDDLPFWMVGEVFPHGVSKDDYFVTANFDSLINFDFVTVVRPMLAKDSLVDSAAELDATYAYYADALQDPELDVLSYLSSHDTRLVFAEVAESPERQKEAGTALLLVPGAAQIFYGDESGRPLGPRLSDETAGTRSDMNWSSANGEIHDHWRRLATFRRRHAAVGAGMHGRLASPDGTYAFARTLDGGAQDAVVVVIARKP
jgi:alpha-amylase